MTFFLLCDLKIRFGYGLVSAKRGTTRKLDRKNMKNSLFYFTLLNSLSTRCTHELYIAPLLQQIRNLKRTEYYFLCVFINVLWQYKRPHRPNSEC